MQAMDAELARVKAAKSSAKKEQTPAKPGKVRFNDLPAIERPSSKDKGKGKASADDEHEDDDVEMDDELRTMLEREDGDSGDEDEPMDYNLIKNFLESFKSQAGLSGPVGALAGRLEPGWALPRDAS